MKTAIVLFSAAYLLAQSSEPVATSAIFPLPEPISEASKLELPMIVCAPLRACVIELQRGELVQGKPIIGDSVRWLLELQTSGSGRNSVPLIVVKAKTTGLDTDLIVTTDRRAYYLRLVSAADKYMARVAFDYPDERSRDWGEEVSRQRAERQQIDPSSTGKGTADIVVAAPSAHNSGYLCKFVKGKDLSMKPVEVWDDGTRTMIRMPQSTLKRDLPVLLAVVGSKAEVVNYRVKEDLYVADRLFDHAQLVSGTGKTRLQVDIFRKGKQ